MPANVPDSTKERTSYKAPDDYKFHCFGDEVFIQVDTDRFTNHTRTMFNKRWEPYDFSLCYPLPHSTPNKPKNAEDMIPITLALAKPFAYVRVDLYNLNGDIIMGELTYTHGGGTEKFSPNQWDTKLGTLWG